MPRRLRIETAGVFAPLLQPSRYKGAYGGRGGAKSHFFAGLLIENCLRTPGYRFACIREIQQSLEQSVKRLLEDKIAAFHVGAHFRIRENRIDTPGGGLIGFHGMQNHTAESMKSLEGYDGAWFEEAQTASQRSLDLLRPTIRKAESELWFSWNPRSTKDPVDKLLRATPPPGAVVVRATYTDNPWMPEVLVKELEWDRQHDPEKYAHIWLGDYERHAESRVFKNWTIQAFETPDDVTFYYGGDWGFSVDPTVLIRCFVNQETRTLYVDREVYQVGCEIDHTPALFDQLDGGRARAWPITADSARPETISYMRRHGYPRVRPAHKGPGSVEEGVTFLQNFNILVHPRCQHAIDELTMYRYETDRLTREVVPKLQDQKNHVIDALRYAVESLRIKTGAGFTNLAGL